jgi:hypothetical protein
MIAQLTLKDDSNEKNGPELRPVLKKKKKSNIVKKVIFEVNFHFPIFVAPFLNLLGFLCYNTFLLQRKFPFEHKILKIIY